jgi:hypothetical protein
MGADPFHWVNQLYATWLQNPVHATLVARLQHENITPQVLGIVAVSVQQAQAEAYTLQATPVGSNWPGFAVMPGSGGQVQSLASFHAMLALVAQHNGDPPSSIALREHALDIILGRHPAEDGVRLAGTETALGLKQIEVAAQVARLAGQVARLAGMESAALVRPVGMLAAALAIPRPQLLALYGMSPAQASTGDAFEQLMQQARELLERDSAKAEEVFLDALDLAGRSPAPADDIEALRQLMLLSGQVNLRPDTVRRCATTACGLVEAGHRGDAIAQIVDLLQLRASTYGLSEELDPPLATSGTALLDGDLSRQLRVPLACSTARSWLRSGRADQADRVLTKLQAIHPDPTETLKIACARAEVDRDSGDPEGATDVLLESLEMSRGLGWEECREALHMLIGLWPRERAGVDEWLDDYRRGVQGMQEPMRTHFLVNLVFALARLGRRGEALQVGRGIDFIKLRQGVAPHFHPWIDDVEQSLHRQLAALEADRGA